MFAYKNTWFSIGSSLLTYHLRLLFVQKFFEVEIGTSCLLVLSFLTEILFSWTPTGKIRGLLVNLARTLRSPRRRWPYQKHEILEVQPVRTIVHSDCTATRTSCSP